MQFLKNYEQLCIFESLKMSLEISFIVYDYHAYEYIREYKISSEFTF